MGSNNTTRRVSFEADENDNVTIVKGIRLSENVINRMREPSPMVCQPPPSVPPQPPPSVPPQPPPVETQVTPSTAPAVDEAELRKKITSEMQQGFEMERSQTEQDQRKRLEEERALARTHAQANVQQEVGRILDMEHAAAQEAVRRAVMKERLSSEEERLRAQLYELEQKAKQLEERDKELHMQDAYYKEELARLEERSAEFYKVTTENFQKAAEEVNSKFKRYEVNPICTELQGQILKCYQENLGKTLQCSSLAGLYMQCVNNAKQNKVRTGG